MPTFVPTGTVVSKGVFAMRYRRRFRSFRRVRARRVFGRRRRGAVRRIGFRM